MKRGSEAHLTHGTGNVTGASPPQFDEDPANVMLGFEIPTCSRTSNYDAKPNPLQPSFSWCYHLLITMRAQTEQCILLLFSSTNYIKIFDISALCRGFWSHVLFVYHVSLQHSSGIAFF